MKYTATYTTTFNIAHNLPEEHTREFDTVEELIKWMEGLMGFLEGIDTVAWYKIVPA